MKRALYALMAGTVLSGLAAAYAAMQPMHEDPVSLIATAQAADLAPVATQP